MFESNTLNQNELKAFETMARLKLNDLADYLKIMNDSSAEKTLSREVNAVVYPVEEFQQKVKSDHHFVKTVLEGDKIFLIGDEDELNRISQ